MKARLLPAMLSLLVFCHLVAAQDYQIRADTNINLRATYSLESAIVETVPAGSILQVVGRFNRWLKIDRDGTMAWMADWVSYTRLTGSDQTQTRTSTSSRDSGQTQSEIDNCCFVDRQCTVDADWVSGYWAFQNGQCAAPLQSGLQTSSQLGRGVAIEGSEDFIGLVKAALELLKNRAPQWYTYVVNGLDKVKEVPESQGYGVHVVERRYDFQLLRRNQAISTLPYTTNDVIWTAGNLVHEACHVYRFEAGLPPGGLEGETACTKVQLQALEPIDPHDQTKGRQVLQITLANIHRPEYQWWH